MTPGIPPAVAALPPLHEFYLHRTMPRRRLPVIAPQSATRYSAKPILLGCRLSAARFASYRPNEARKLLCPMSSLERATARPLHELRAREVDAMIVQR